MIEMGEERTTKRNDPTRRAGSAAMVYDNGVSAFDVVGDGETSNLVKQS